MKIACSRQSLKKLSSWYLNGSLSNYEHGEIDKIRKNDPEFDNRIICIDTIGRIVAQQPTLEPSYNIESHLLEQITIQPRVLLARIHLHSIFLAIVVFVFLWAIAEPGISLRWSTERDVDTYRVYRSAGNSSKYVLIHEIEAKIMKSPPHYVDAILLPWGTYSYVVEGISGDGNDLVSQAVTSEASQLLPVQAMLLITSIFVGYIGGYFVRYFSRLLHSGDGLRERYD